MKIPVVTALGRGPTELAAFDAALVAAGVADRNLIPLSSVLPPDSVVMKMHDQLEKCPGEWGDRLYCVLAEHRTFTPGEQVWAGIGWVQDETGQGLLVEHHAGSMTGLTELIDRSLDALLDNRGLSNLSMPVRGRHIAGGTCDGVSAVCALAVAVFRSEPWDRSWAAFGEGMA